MGFKSRVFKKKYKLWKMLAVSTIASFFIITPAYSASKTLLVLGDSLSAEYGLERGKGWVPLLQQHLQQKSIDYQVVNASISGDTTIGGKNRLPALLKQHTPKIVIIELGSNDALRGLQLTMTQNNLRSIIEQSQAIGAKVLLVGMQIPPNYGKTYTEAFNRLYTDLSTSHKTALVPFLFDKIAGDLSYFQQDQIHPNEKAQPILLNNVLIHLTPLLK